MFEYFVNFNELTYRIIPAMNYFTKLLTGILFLTLFIPLNTLKCQTSGKKLRSVFENHFYNNSNIRIKFLKENLLRISILPEGAESSESGLNRYGFINEIFQPNLKLKYSEARNNFSIESPYLKVKVNQLSGNILITDLSGKIVLLNQTSSAFFDTASQVKFMADKDEDWLGFGDQSRTRIYHRGHIADCHVRNVKSYIPVPFFMSTLYTGILVNTSHRVVFDMCKSDPDRYFWTDGSKRIDYYFMAGKSFGDLIDLYTELTGKPKLPPEWSFGLWYICRTQANDYEAVNDAYNFRREGIPCDVIGLEPGWMEKNYDYSTSKTWSKDRFPIPSYAFNGPHNFFNSIERMGFKLELWLCNDYDLSYKEERRLKFGESGQVGKSNIKSFDFVEIDEHLSPTVKKESDVSKPESKSTEEEPWFEHLKKFIDQGVSFFKQDGSRQVNEHPSRKWGNGMEDAEIHNLYPLFYSRQMYEGFKNYTNRRPVVFTPCGWTGFQAWSGTWTGDTGGRLTTLGAMLNTSVTGHSWATNDMEVAEKEGIHFGYLQPWSQINSWNYFRMPWAQGAELCKMHKYYAELRSQLIPYIYSWANHSAKTGWPLLIPLTFEFPDDKNCRTNLHQYFLGRDLMVGIYDNKIYFPAGEWKDYWTGEIIIGNQEKTVSWPEDRGGALYVRSGGIIPFGPIMQYRGEKILDEITLYVFPGEKETTFNLYEDDGISFDYEQGKFSITNISAKSDTDGIYINIGKSNGSFSGKINDRTWNMIIHSDKAPENVMVDKECIKSDSWSWDDKRKEVFVKNISSPVEIYLKK